jgi:hypothetical protein
MATYTAISLPGAEAAAFFMTAGAIENWSRGVGQSEDYPAIDDTTLGFATQYVSKYPVSMPQNSLTGVRLPAYVDDYYYRFHIVPNRFDLRVASDTIVTTQIWNAYFDQSTCSSVLADYPTEFSIQWSSGEPPFDMWSLTTKTLTISIPVDGLPTFISTIRLNFGAIKGEATFILNVTRVQAFVWTPLVPLTETLEWKTDIMTGADKSDEQRMSIRPAPRQGVQFRIYSNDEQDLAKKKTLIHNWLKRLWAFPVWWEKELHTTTISSGATSITMDTTDADWRDDSLGLILVDENSWEIIQIDAVSPTSLTLTSAVQSTWTGAKLIMPLRFMFTNAPVTSEKFPDGYAYISLDLLCNENIVLTTYSAPTTYQGRTVLTAATYVKPNVEVIHDPLTIRSDYGLGSFRLSSDSEFNLTTQAHHFQNYTKSETWEFREFLHSLYGRRTPVYIPTFQEDLRISRNVGSGDTNIYIENIGLHEYVGVNNMRRDLAFVFPDGTLLLRRITNTSEVSVTEETVTIDSNLGQAVAVGDCEISFLDLYRLASDKVEIEWIEPNYNTCDLTFIRVQH